MGYEAQLPFDGIWGKIVEAPDNKTIYINNPIGAYYSDAWIKGERTTGDTIEVKLPQQFVHEEYDGMSTDAWLYKLVPVKVEQDGETYTTFKPDSTSQTVKYVWRNDSIVLVNTTQDTKLLGMCTEAGEWYGYGDYIQQYTVFDQQPVAPKDETKATQMSITYYDSGQMYGRVKKAVREGNDIYIAGLNENIPSGWAKGTISGNKATFSGHQYMGLDTVTASYAFFEPVSHSMVWDSEIGDSIENLTLADAITFDYDADKGTLSTDSTFVANQGYKMFNQVFTYDGATIEPWTEKAATPLAVDASTMSYMPFSEEYGYGLLAFAPNEFDADGYILDANKLYYSIYLDDDVLTIDPDDYTLFPYETTEIPFTYSDMLDFVNYAGILTLALNSMSCRFVSYEYHRGNKEKADIYVNSILGANLILAGAITLCAVFMVWKLEYILTIPKALMFDVKLTFAIVFINYIFGICFSVFNSGTFVKNRMDLYYLRNLFSYVLKLVLTILIFTLFDVRIFFIALTTLICNAYMNVATYILMRKLLPDLKLNLRKFKWKTLSEVLRSGVWNSVQSLSDLMISGLNSLLTNRFIGTAAGGYLQSSKTIPNYILQLGQQLAQVFSPKFTILYAQGDYDRLVKEAKRSMRLVGFIISTPVAGFIVFGYQFYALWLKNYSPAELQIVQTVSVITTIPYLFSCVAFPLIQINTACNKVRTPVLVALAAGIANILVVFPLGKADALTLNVLACCTAAFTILRYGVFQPYYAAKILARNRLFFYGTLLRNVLATAVIGVVLYAAKGLFTYGSWGHFFIAIALCGAVGYVLAFFLLFNPGEYKEIVHMFLSKMKKKTA